MATFAHGYPHNHLTVNYHGTILAFNGQDGEYTCGIGGENLRKIPREQQFAHCMWHGQTDLRQGTLLPPGHAIATAGVDEIEKTTICNGPYFWHSASSRDGKWIISDTNWPDQGLMLIHATSGRYIYYVGQAQIKNWTSGYDTLASLVQLG